MKRHKSGNEELAKEFEFQSDVVKTLKAIFTLEDIQSSPDLAEAERLANKYFSDKEPASEKRKIANSKSLNRKLKTYWIGAAAAVLIGLFTTISLVNSDPYAALYTKYYSPFDEASLNFRGAINHEINQQVADGIQFYIQNEYNKSLTLFNELESSFPQEPVIQLYIGLNLMSLEQYDDAKTKLEVYLNSFEVFIPEAKWYLSLCYLKTGSIEDASILLDELKDYQGKLGEDAGKLNHKLEKRL